ncbi:thermonuclease family protein [Bacillus sp. T3]|uniref:thermonuclease family protein n=1 Tax=Bacillus sp. T3 TaxID=467262 RepID=UPI002982B162|nr:thermonuclease family protein [Bacillus sp. T3]
MLGILTAILIIGFYVSKKNKIIKYKHILCIGATLLFIGIFSGCTGTDTSMEKEAPKETEQKTPSNNLTEDNRSNQSKEEIGNSQINGLKAKVLSVTDGDTIKVQLENGTTEKVRLILIDTPETKHPRLGVQPFGKEASSFTTKELTDKNITLELDVEERDQYGRLLAYVWIDNTLYNEVLINEGLARVAVFPPNTKYVDRFREAQSKAQKAGIGIWSIEDYVQNDGYDSDQTGTEPPAANSNSNASGSSGSYINDPSDDQETNLDCKEKIKGNANSHIYHVPGGRYYEKTTDNIVWFCSEADAQSAGYRKSQQ